MSHSDQTEIPELKNHCRVQNHSSVQKKMTKICHNWPQMDSVNSSAITENRRRQEVICWPYWGMIVDMLTVTGQLFLKNILFFSFCSVDSVDELSDLCVDEFFFLSFVWMDMKTRSHSHEGWNGFPPTNCQRNKWCVYPNWRNLQLVVFVFQQPSETSPPTSAHSRASILMRCYINSPHFYYSDQLEEDGRGSNEAWSLRQQQRLFVLSLSVYSQFWHDEHIYPWTKNQIHPNSVCILSRWWCCEFTCWTRAERSDSLHQLSVESFVMGRKVFCCLMHVTRAATNDYSHC